MSETVSRSWFAVFNNPQDHGYTGTPEEIIERMKNEWIESSSNRKGYWAYCISAQGMHHIHMVLENICTMRFSLVKKAYPQAHLEPTKGMKKQVMAYINKEPPFDEKDEKVICTTSYGDIEGCFVYDLSSRSSALQIAEQLIADGMTPKAIMDQDIRFRTYEAIIRKAYFDMRSDETPTLRDVNVIWHLGASGSGKTYTYVQLCDQHGEDKVYLFNDYANNGIGGFDNYQGEEILFMDELKTGCLTFSFLLTLLQGYKTQLRCRYANSVALWNEVHIASIYPPEDIYDSLVFGNCRHTDTKNQLLRRISTYVYHYVENGEYKTFELPAEKYTDYNSLIRMAKGEMLPDGFIKAEETPFQS